MQQHSRYACLAIVFVKCVFPAEASLFPVQRQWSGLVYQVHLAEHDIPPEQKLHNGTRLSWKTL